MKKIENSLQTRYLKIIILFLLLLYFQGSCSQKVNEIKHRDLSLIKSDYDLNILKKKAYNKDGNAAWFVFLHYFLGLRDYKQAEPWLLLADSLENKNARHFIKNQSAPRYRIH